MDQPLPLDLPAGVYANGTEQEAKGRWMIADLIRWYEGRMRPVGGWTRFTSTPLPEPARGILSWRRNDGLPFAAWGTASHLYETSGSLNNDITPGLSPPSIVSIATATTGGTLAANTYYYVVTALNANGETLASMEVKITTTGSTSANTISWNLPVPGATSYRIYRGTATGAENVYYTKTPGTSVSFVDTGATSASGTPPTLNGAVSLTAGNVDALIGGFGSEGYGTGQYGESTSSAVLADATTWDLDSFGQVLLGVSSTDGSLYQWDAQAEPNRASLVVATGSTPTPSGAIGMFVTDDRMCVMLGPNNSPNELVWSNQGDYTMWDVNVNTTAGDLQLKSHGRILAGCKMLGTNLIWTDADVHTMTYVGYPFIYGTQRAGSNCGLIARKAFAGMVNFAAWMGDQAFYMYNGVVQELKSDVRKAVFDNMNVSQKSKVCCGVNSNYSEIWWFFPSTNSLENDSYCYWNFKDNHWGLGIGAFGRTAWIDKEVWPFPIACGADYNMYEQESGWLAGGLSRNSMVKAVSGPIDLNNGLRIFEGNQMLYDTNDGTGAVALSMLTKYTPNGVETTWGPYLMRSDGYTDCRFNGRQFKMSLAQTTDGLWQWGNLRILGGATGGQR